MKYNIYTNGLKINIFDIETMGLYPNSDIIISASFCNEDGSDLRQYFCEDPSSEILLLSKINEEFKRLDAIITYNGKKFDIPFLETRAKKYGFSFESMPWNIDIYRYLKGYWDLASEMKSLSQASVETALGLKDERTDTISGSECISLYNQYLLSGEREYKEKILLHNGDDVRQLAKISESLSFLPFHRIVYCSGRYLYKDSNDNQRLPIKIGPVEESNQLFVVNANYIQGLMPLSVFEEYYTLDYDSISGSVKLVLRSKELEDYLYVDLNKMPIDINEYVGMKGFTNNYLILKKGTELFFKEINKLVGDLLLKV